MTSFLQILSNKSPLDEETLAEFKLLSRPFVRHRRGVTSFGVTREVADYKRRKRAERQFAIEYYEA